MKNKLMGLGLFALADNAVAHTGHGAGQLLAAFTHPMTGLDHLTVFLALGFLLAQGRERRLSSLLGLMLLMGIGMFLGHQGLYAPMVEAAIACSLVVLGVVCFKRWIPNQVALFALLCTSVVLHGLAHGVLLQPLSVSVSLSVGVMMMLGALVVALLGFSMANNRLVKRFALQQWLAAGMLLLGGSLMLSA